MAVTADNDTLLVIQGMGIPRWAARALTERLRPIDAAVQISRSINGLPINFAQEQFKKYALTVSCTDQRVLAFDGIWPGDEVLIDCVTELAYPMYGTPSRTVVSGSEREEGDFVFYRPQLNCVFLGFSSETPEWEGRVSWEANFEEI